jgi:hypothetical protein
MNCREARGLAAEREVGTLAADRRTALEAHLAGCAACRTRAASESRLTRDLALLREQPAPAVEVVARVMARVTAAPRQDPLRLPVGALAASLAALAIAGLGGLAALWRAAPDLPRIVATARIAAAGGAELLGLALRALRTSAGFVFDLGLDLLRAAATLLVQLEPLFAAATVFGSIVMLTTIVLVVGRDLRGLTPARIERGP